MHAAIFGNVAAIIQKLYANRVRYHSRANEIKQFIRVHRIEEDLANRLEDYFHTTWSLSGGVDTSEVMFQENQSSQSIQIINIISIVIIIINIVIIIVWINYSTIS